MFTIEDGNGIKLFQTESDYGNNINGDFRTNSLLKINDTPQDNITLYPNPTNGMVHIENAEGFQIEIYNILGKLIFNKATISKQEAINLRSEEHTSELQSRGHLVCRLLLEKKK